MIISVNVALMYNRKILTGERMPGPTWPGKLQLPGGRVEDGESLLHAAQREVLEECSILVEASKLVPILVTLNRWPHGGYFKCQSFQYECSDKEAHDIRNIEPAKNKMWLWLPPTYRWYRPPCQKVINHLRGLYGQ